MKVVLFGFFTVRPAWTETAGNVSVRACLREAGETGFLLHGAGRIGLALLREDIIIGTQQQHTTFRFPDNVLRAQRLEKSKDFGLYFSADFCPGWGHQALSITHNVRESHGTADEFAVRRGGEYLPCWLPDGLVVRKHAQEILIWALAAVFQTQSSTFLPVLKPLGC